MVINPEKLLCLCFPSFGHIMILLIDVAAKDSNNAGLTSLFPSSTLRLNSAAPISEPREQQPCGRSPREGSGVAASTPARQPRRCLSTALALSRHRPRAALPSQPAQDGHSALSGEAGGRGHSISRRSWDAAKVTEQATGEAADSAPQVTQPGLGWVPR